MKKDTKGRIGRVTKLAPIVKDGYESRSILCP